jgi:hypothetical protein
MAPVGPLLNQILHVKYDNGLLHHSKFVLRNQAKWLHQGDRYPLLPHRWIVKNCKSGIYAFASF